MPAVVDGVPQRRRLAASRPAGQQLHVSCRRARCRLLAFPRAPRDVLGELRGRLQGQVLVAAHRADALPVVELAVVPLLAHGAHDARPGRRAQRPAGRAVAQCFAIDRPSGGRHLLENESEPGVERCFRAQLVRHFRVEPDGVPHPALRRLSVPGLVLPVRLRVLLERRRVLERAAGHQASAALAGHCSRVAFRSAVVSRARGRPFRFATGVP